MGIRDTFILLSLGTLVAGWDYSDTSAWCSDEFPACCGRSQSPVDIDLKSVASRSPVEDDLAYRTFGYDSNLKGRLHNNGHTVEFELGVGGHIPVLLWPDGETQYAFKQLHFHWGGRDCRGSEHTLGGRAFPLEVHMVHYNTSYGNFANAVDKEGGLAVIGIFFRISGGRHSRSLERLDSGLSFLTDNDVGEMEIAIRPADFFDEVKDTSHYFSYSGSLTTPPCFESVRWTVLGDPISIQPRQLRNFRRLLAGEGEEGERQRIVDNFRPPQPLNGRTVASNLPRRALQRRKNGGVGVGGRYGGGYSGECGADDNQAEKENEVGSGY